MLLNIPWGIEKLSDKGYEVYLKRELPECFPENNAGCHRYIQGMLGAILGDLNAGVTQINHLLIHAANFMTKYQGIFSCGIQGKLLKGDGILSLLHRKNRIS